MTLPARLVDFLQTYEQLAERCTSHRWGTVSRDSSFHLVHDANRAWVCGFTTPSLDELRDAMAIAQRAVPVPFRQVEVVDVGARPGLWRR